MSKQRIRSFVATCSLSAAALALLVSPACGSEDSTRKTPPSRPYDGGAGGTDDDAIAGAAANAPSGGSVTTAGGAAGAPDAPSGGAAGAPSSTGGETAAGAPSSAGAAGTASEACDSVAPSELQGTWTSSCNGYVCGMSITAAGDYGAGCTNGQYESGAIVDGKIDTTGEGGPYQPYSTKGTLTRSGCDTLQRDYIGQIPPNTGPEMHYSCELVRGPDCAPTLLEALTGRWDGKCGDSSQCVTTIAADGKLSSVCTNGQSSSGMVAEIGTFSDTGSGGGFPDYSTSGVIALTACDSFVLAYTWQSPPHQGKKTSAKCTYTRQLE